MERSLEKALQKDLTKKAVFLSGPRQCGKTYLSKKLFRSYDYLNFDILNDRKRLLKHEWYRDRELLIFDEIHKMKKWKGWLKGILDSDQEDQKLLVTGSAKLNTYKKVGDSLAGRYLTHRLHPFDLKELAQQRENPELGFLKRNAILSNETILDRLLETSGFPEPFLTNDMGFYNRWRENHLDAILRQDILETESIRSIKQIETLVLMLTERVGSPMSYNSIREDLSSDDKSIKRWVDILENSYVLFRIFPFASKSISNSLKKAPKIYLYDYARVEDPGARFENLVALSLLKEIHGRFDGRGEIYDLQYLRNKQKNEIDFLITKNKKPHVMIEVKESDADPSSHFKVFEKYFPDIPHIQLVRNLKQGFQSKAGVWVLPASQWLEKMDF